MLGINSLHVSMPEAPFGGVKESGWGSECGIEGLQEYCSIVDQRGLTRRQPFTAKQLLGRLSHKR